MRDVGNSSYRDLEVVAADLSLRRLKYLSHKKIYVGPVSQTGPTVLVKE